NFRRELARENGIAGTIAIELAVRVVRRLRAECQRLALREEIRHQQIVLVAERVQRLAEADEIAGHVPGALMEELVKRVLAVGARLSPENGAGLVSYALSSARDALSVALHGELLEIGG